MFKKIKEGCKTLVRLPTYLANHKKYIKLLCRGEVAQSGCAPD